MADVSDADLKQALKKRRSYITDNLEVLTMKVLRRLLEEDLGLPEKSLVSHKEYIQVFVDKLVARQSEEHGQKDEQKSPAKKRKTANFVEDDGLKVKKKKKQTEGEEAPAAASARSSDMIDQAKRICKQATVKIPPSTYAKTKSLTEVEAELESLLNKHGLSLSSSSQYIEKVRRKLEKDRELEGIDVSNIVVGDRRARRTAAPINYAALEGKNSSDDDSSEDEEQEMVAGEDSQSQGAASDADTSDHAADSSDDSKPDAAADAPDSKPQSKAGNKPPRSRNTALHDSDDDD